MPSEMPLTAEPSSRWINAEMEDKEGVALSTSLTDSRSALPKGKTFLVKKLPMRGEVSSNESIQSTFSRELETPEIIANKITRETESFRILKKFDGVVLSLQDDTVSVRLYERNSGAPKADISFAFEEFPYADRQILTEGMPVVWTLGLGKREGGSIERKSIVYARRMIRPTVDEIESAKSEIDELMRGI